MPVDNHLMSSNDQNLPVTDPFGAAKITDHDHAPDPDWFKIFGTGPAIPPRFDTIIAGFAHFAARTPDNIAVICDGTHRTYRQIDAASDRLANRLIAEGVMPGDMVGLYLKRSVEMVVGIVAAMKVGAAYAPQHLGVAPESALRHISQITKSKVVLTLSGMIPDVPALDSQSVIEIDVVTQETGTPPPAFHSPAKPDDICMVLFTSGTTGTPNGVQVTHRNLCNILLTAPGDLGIQPGTRVGQILSIAFDMAAWETLGCLANGGTLMIRDSDIQQTAEQVDVLIATPSILGTLDATRCRHVKTVAVAGEPCPRPLADTWASFCNFYNSCGPTETTIINTAIEHSPQKPDLTIGKPTPNNMVYILDDNLNPMPFGEKGEMWAGGDCVTAGYLDNPSLTADRYRPDPFRQGHMMFRTRDLGRWTPSGELRHCGRVDDLVKIRGFRVELDGVSRALEQTETCKQAVTLKYDDRTLVAFVSPATVSPDAAIRSVTNMLPYYCAPEIVIALDDLPKTPRGKLDKRLMLEMAAQKLSTLTPCEAAE